MEMKQPLSDLFAEESSPLRKVALLLTALFFFFIPIATSPAEIAGLLALGFSLLSGAFSRDRLAVFFQSKIAYAVVLFVGLHWVGLLWTSDVTKGLEFARRTYVWIYALMVVAITRNHTQSGFFIKAFLAGLTVTSSIFTMQLLGILPTPQGFARGFMNHITLSVLVAFAIVFVSYWFRGLRDSNSRLMPSVLIAVFLIVLTFGIGRAGYVVFVVLMPFLIANIFGRLNIKVFIATTVVVVLLIPSVSPTLKSRIDRAIEDIKAYNRDNPNTSVGIRLYMWQKSVELISERPIFGFGTGSYSKEVSNRHSKAIEDAFVNISQPHNSYLYAAVSFGIVGLFSLLWLFGAVLLESYKQRKTLIGYACMLFTIALMVSSLTDNQLMSFGTAHLYALLVGLLFVERKYEQPQLS